MKISDATKRNWIKLNITEEEIETKLSSRANKSNSKKHIIPTEYFNNIKNISIIKNFIEQTETFDTKTIIFNIALNRLLNLNLIEFRENHIYCENENILKVLNDFEEKNIINSIINFQLPEDEEDILGIIYQILMSEGNKNQKGSYYTPQKIVSYLTNNFSEKTIFLDPCCGTGKFLLKSAEIIKNPENIYGADLDNIACFISKINLIIKFMDKQFLPKIYNINSLSDEGIEFFKNKKINFIATNPPWGSNKENIKNKIFSMISSKERFSYFIVLSKLLNTDFAYYVLPESILNVKIHSDIRKFILDNFNIDEIKNWKNVFSGVLSKVITLKLSKNKSEKINFFCDKTTKKIPVKIYKNNLNYVFNFTDEKENKILNQIYSCPHTTLKESKWALGIVTGNNSKHISTETQKGEKIYTGKEVTPYLFKESNKYIKYDRTKFQQVAPDEMYRAKEKLVYKFISKKLIFAYDDKQRLILNSANILIPKVKTHSVKTVLACLNSELFQYIYSLKFNELKVLRGNLSELPLPLLNEKEKELLEKYVNKFLDNQNEKYLKKINDFIYNYFKIDAKELSIINN